jgi:hypothetical protein
MQHFIETPGVEDASNSKFKTIMLLRVFQRQVEVSLLSPWFSDLAQRRRLHHPSAAL